MTSQDSNSPNALSDLKVAVVPGPPKGRPSLTQLFFLCLRVGLVSFGGGLSGWLYREFVITRGWVSDDDFASNLAIAQMLPGPNVANLVNCIGEQLRGPVGALTCLAGLFTGPFFAVIALYLILERMSNIGVVQTASDGVAFAAIGLIMLVCIRGIKRAARFPSALVVVGATALMVGVLRWPLIPVVIAMATISVGIAWRRL